MIDVVTFFYIFKQLFEKRYGTYNEKLVKVNVPHPDEEKIANDLFDLFDLAINDCPADLSTFEDEASISAADNACSEIEAAVSNLSLDLDED